jgi:hypothetical protein
MPDFQPYLKSSHSPLFIILTHRESLEEAFALAEAACRESTKNSQFGTGKLKEKRWINHKSKIIKL